MDDDIIDDLAAAFFEQGQAITNSLADYTTPWWQQLLDDIIAIGLVIHSHSPTYDMRYFYKNAGYPEPYPVHEMI